MASWPWSAIVTVVVALLTGVGACVRYVLKVESSFADQRVINAKTVGALDLITEKLHSHEQIVEGAHEALVQRIDILERRGLRGGNAL